MNPLTVETLSVEKEALRAKVWRLALGIVPLLASGALGAQPYATPYGQPYYAPPYYGQPYYGQPSRPPESPQPRPDSPQYRRLPPTNAQGVPPAYQPPPAPGGMPGQRPQGYPGYQPNWPGGYAQGPAQSSQVAPPRMEWSLEVMDPYLQQPVVLKLDVVSRENLSTANLELPASGDALMKTLQGPSTSTRTTKGQREILNSFVLTVVPLRAGDLELPPIKVTGTLAGSGLGQGYEAHTERPIRLQVRPSMTSVRPWLPLKSLTLKSSLDREGTLEPGQPVTLALEIAAIGGTAVQLPSLEAQLNGPDFRVYREQTLTNTELSSDGRQLSATRTEYYTLVPQVGGRLSLPEMSIAWWNVDQGVREVARLPIKTLTVRGGGPFGFPVAALTSSEWVKFWVPLAGLLLLVAGYWVGVLYRGRPLSLGIDLLGLGVKGLRAGHGFALKWLGPYARSLGPAALLAATRRFLGRTLPASSRFLRCVRYANQAATPDEWRDRFEEESRACRSFKGEFTQAVLTRHILTVRPGADPKALSRLMGQLDAGIYGRETLDFQRWKRDLMRQVGRGARLPQRSEASGRLRWAALPALNPSSLRVG
ncbi:BatD family protein [Thiocystis violacea]|uniref:BatD family protein n=1 Tax=Thiocystis violacea TaxID=13725 RepID=UPI001F5B07AC|nr:BatD family protein [Thiocystis violacea]